MFKRALIPWTKLLERIKFVQIEEHIVSMSSVSRYGEDEYERCALGRPDSPSERRGSFIHVSVGSTLNSVSNDDDEEADEHRSGRDDTKNGSWSREER